MTRSRFQMLHRFLLFCSPKPLGSYGGFEKRPDPWGVLGFGSQNHNRQWETYCDCDNQSQPVSGWMGSQSQQRAKTVVQHKNAPNLEGCRGRPNEKNIGTTFKKNRSTNQARSPFNFQQNAANLAGTKNGPNLGGFSFARRAWNNIPTRRC